MVSQSILYVCTLSRTDIRTTHDSAINSHVPASHGHLVPADVQILVLEGCQHVLKEVLQEAERLILTGVQRAEVSVHGMLTLVALGHQVRPRQAPRVGVT